MIKQCEPNGGIKFINVDPLNSVTKVYCMNEAVFIQQHK